MFNLKKLDTESLHEDGAWMHVIDPENNLPAYADEEMEKPVRVMFKGYLSDVGKKIALKSRNKAMRKAVINGGKQKDLTLSDIESTIEEDAENLSELCVTWENLLDENGKEIEFTKAKAKELFKSFAALRKQALTFLDSDKVFFKA